MIRVYLDMGVTVFISNLIMDALFCNSDATRANIFQQAVRYGLTLDVFRMK